MSSDVGAAPPSVVVSDEPGRMPLATFVWDAAPHDAAVIVLVLHGGAVDGREANRPWSHNTARLLPFAWALKGVPGPVAVARLRFRFRGWNGEEASPLPDTRWALAQIRSRYPGRPIALVGHSMGGRVAMHAGDDPDVRLVMGLSPWIERGDPRPGAGRRTVLVHGDRDVICPLWASRHTVEQMREDGLDATLVRVARSDHAMLLRPRLWTDLVTAVVGSTFANELRAAPRSPVTGASGIPAVLDAIDDGARGVIDI
ncbi:MAG: alpha/beta fold hydrolase [Terracoccus sp.]